MSNRLRIAAAAAALLVTGNAIAHGGGLNAEGCHHERRTGGYHCHRGPAAAPSVQRLAPALRPTTVPRAHARERASGEVYYPNCTAARAAGAAPVRRGEPGYAPHLDRDDDGIGCE